MRNGEWIKRTSDRISIALLSFAAILYSSDMDRPRPERTSDLKASLEQELEEAYREPLQEILSDPAFKKLTDGNVSPGDLSDGELSQLLDRMEAATSQFDNIDGYSKLTDVNYGPEIVNFLQFPGSWVPFAKGEEFVSILADQCRQTFSQSADEHIRSFANFDVDTVLIAKTAKSVHAIAWAPAQSGVRREQYFAFTPLACSNVQGLLGHSITTVFIAYDDPDSTEDRRIQIRAGLSDHTGTRFHISHDGERISIVQWHPTNLVTFDLDASLSERQRCVDPIWAELAGLRLGSHGILTQIEKLPDPTCLSQEQDRVEQYQIVRNLIPRSGTPAARRAARELARNEGQMLSTIFSGESGIRIQIGEVAEIPGIDPRIDAADLEAL
ncbi:MAG: hypothetical protein AAFS13_05735 [Pseudomonadota bacterium]